MGYQWDSNGNHWIHIMWESQFPMINVGKPGAIN
jgi:hypothetical protein